MHIQTKRIYDTPANDDGLRVLVDRLWPRGISKADAHIDVWAKAIAPSNALRTWYGHDAERWPEFAKRYRAELKNNVPEVRTLREQIAGRTVTLLYAAKNIGRSNADVLLNYLKEDEHA